MILAEEAYVNEPLQSRKKLQLLIEQGVNINEKFEIVKDGIHTSILYLDIKRSDSGLLLNKKNITHW